jgi:vacuolar-type H+-ATPase subunit F/Vma7
MAAAVYIGDEISAAGWRLAGVRIRVPEPGDEAAALSGARAESPLVLLSAATAVHIDAAMLAAACSALEPLVVVLPDPQGEVTLPDLAGRLRTQLGLEA